VVGSFGRDYADLAYKAECADRDGATDEVLGAAVEEYGREAAEVVLTRTEDGSVQIETRCKPEADEFATGETVSNAASNMVGRWCE